MKPPLAECLNLEIKGVDPLARIAALIVLAMEIESQKLKLGYKGPGGWQQFREEANKGERHTFEEYCQEQTGFTPETITNFHQCADAVRMRLRISSKPGAKALLHDMETPPSELTKEERLSLVERIASLGLVHGDTQTYLRKEFKAAKLPSDAATRHLVSPWPADDAEEIRKRAISMKPVVQKEAKRREADPEMLLRVVMKTLQRMRADGTLNKLLPK